MKVFGLRVAKPPTSQQCPHELSLTSTRVDTRCTITMLTSGVVAAMPVTVLLPATNTAVHMRASTNARNRVAFSCLTVLYFCEHEGIEGQEGIKVVSNMSGAVAHFCNLQMSVS